MLSLRIYNDCAWNLWDNSRDNLMQYNYLTFTIFLLHRPSQQKNRVKVWLYEDTRMSLEGQIIGFDEYMNMTLDDAVEIDKKTGKKTNVGRILLKGDAITLLQNANPPRPSQA
eukprot:24437_1